MKRFPVLLFDADNTLFDFDRAEDTALAQTLSDIGFDPSPALAEEYRKVNAAVWSEFERDEIDAETLKVERFRRFLSAHPEIGCDAAAMSAIYLSRLSRNGQLLPGAEEVLAVLAPGRTIGIITNGLEQVQTGRFESSPIRRFVDFIVISETVGYRKPMREFFDVALSRAGNPDRDDCLVIGDSLSSDIAGGNRCGIPTCWYNPAGVVNTSVIRPDYEIASLPALIPIVGA